MDVANTFSFNFPCLNKYVYLSRWGRLKFTVARPAGFWIRDHRSHKYMLKLATVKLLPEISAKLRAIKLNVFFTFVSDRRMSGIVN